MWCQFCILNSKNGFFFKRILSCGLHLFNYSLWVVWYSKTWANQLKCYWIRKATLTEAARCRISLQHTQTVTYGKNKKQNKTGYWYLLTAYGLSVNHSYDILIDKTINYLNQPCNHRVLVKLFHWINIKFVFISVLNNV